LSEARKKIVKALARWHGAGGVMVGASPERINVKMELCSNLGKRKIKRIACGHEGRGEWEFTVALQKYTPVSSRARGTN
jgi:hypothetical protein